MFLRVWTVTFCFSSRALFQIPCFFFHSFWGEKKVQKEIAIHGYSEQPWHQVNNSVVQTFKLGHPLLFTACIHTCMHIVIMCCWANPCMCLDHFHLCGLGKATPQESNELFQGLCSFQVNVSVLWHLLELFQIVWICPVNIRSFAGHPWNFLRKAILH